MNNSSVLYCRNWQQSQWGPRSAKRLVEVCAQIGCNIAKFQLRDFNSLYRNAKSNVEDLGVEYAKDLLKKYELPASAHFELAKYCKRFDVEYMCTPWDENSVELLEEIGVQRYKVASADFDNIPLIKKILETSKLSFYLLAWLILNRFASV